MSFIDAIKDAFSIILLKQDAVERVAKEGSLLIGIGLYVLSGVIGTLLGILISPLLATASGAAGMFRLTALNAAVNIAFLPVQLVISIIASFILVGILWLAAKLFGGKGAYANLAKAVFYYSAALSLVTMLIFIPLALFLTVSVLVGGILSGIFLIAMLVWTIAINAVVLKGVMGLSTGKAIGALVVSLIVIMVIALIIAVVFATLFVALLAASGGLPASAGGF